MSVMRVKVFWEMAGRNARLAKRKILRLRLRIVKRLICKERQMPESDDVFKVAGISFGEDG